jgi:hypothetical protein
MGLNYPQVKIFWAFLHSAAVDIVPMENRELPLLSLTPLQTDYFLNSHTVRQLTDQRLIRYFFVLNFSKLI